MLARFGGGPKSDTAGYLRERAEEEAAARKAARQAALPPAAVTPAQPAQPTPAPDEAARQKVADAEAETTRLRTELRRRERRECAQHGIVHLSPECSFPCYLRVEGVNISQLVAGLEARFVQLWGDAALAEFKRVSGDTAPIMTGYSLAAVVGYALAKSNQ